MSGFLCLRVRVWICCIEHILSAVATFGTELEKERSRFKLYIQELSPLLLYTRKPQEELL